MTESRQNDKIITLSYVAIIFFTAFIYYYKATASYFVADDFFYIVNRDNPYVYTPFTYFFYQPVTFAVYFINYFWAGKSPYNYHLFAITLNAVNLCLAFYFVKIITKRNLYGFLCAIFGAVYYFAADNMIWINCTNNIICSFFYFLTLIYSCKYNSSNKKSDYALTLIFLNLTLYAREMGVSVFIMLFMTDILFYYNPLQKDDRKKLCDKYAFIILFSLIYLFLMALGPSTRYKKITFNRGGYTFDGDAVDFVVNLNWFYFRLFIPFSFGSHAKSYTIHSLIQFIRFKNVILILIILSLFIVRNRFYYFGVLWVLIAISPYLKLNKYFVHTGDRYFYQPRFCFVLITIGLWIYFKEKIKLPLLHKSLKIILIIIFIFYATASWIAVQKRIGWWIIAGDSSEKFLTSFRKQFPELEDKTLLIIRNVPRWADNAPNKLIVLITGAAHALRLFYEKENIEVIPYWDDDYETDMAAMMRGAPSDYKLIFLDYNKNTGFTKWKPPKTLISHIFENNITLYNLNFKTEFGK